ncbi:hypothetical protein SHIRM173S_09747 [Streptomyces hirsutus]
MRAQQPLVDDGDGVVEGTGVDRQPADGLGEVDVGTRAVFPGRLPQRGQIGDPAVGGLHGADGDEGGVRADGLGEPLQRHGPHLEVAADVERVEHRGEVVLDGEHLGARLQ